MSSNNVGHLFTKTITTLKHFATLHHTSLHSSTLHVLSFTLHYPLIWLNQSTFPIVLLHHTSQNYTQHSSQLQTYFHNNELLHCPKELLTISLHFTFYLFIFFTYPINTSLHFAIHIDNSLPFTFYFSSP